MVSLVLALEQNESEICLSIIESKRNKVRNFNFENEKWTAHHWLLLPLELKRKQQVMKKRKKRKTENEC